MNLALPPEAVSSASDGVLQCEPGEEHRLVSPESAPITLFIVHPERIVRESLSTALTQHEEFAVLDTSDGRDATALMENMRARRADIVVLDVALAQRYGSRVIFELRSSAPGTRVLVTGVPDCDADILAIFRIGATGCATRDSSLRALISNIHALMSGQTLCPVRITSMLFSHIARHSQAPIDVRTGRNGRQLTPRELQIIALIDAGLANKEIARRLSLEIQTVKNHVHNILDKLQVRGRIEAARCARVQGMLSPGGTIRQ